MDLVIFPLAALSSEPCLMSACAVHVAYQVGNTFAASIFW
jgi:hypothetical protein